MTVTCKASPTHCIQSSTPRLHKLVNQWPQVMTYFTTEYKCLSSKNTSCETIQATLTEQSSLNVSPVKHFIIYVIHHMSSKRFTALIPRLFKTTLIYQANYSYIIRAEISKGKTQSILHNLNFQNSFVIILIKHRDTVYYLLIFSKYTTQDFQNYYFSKIYTLQLRYTIQS